MGSAVSAPRVLLGLDHEAVLVLLGELSGRADDFVDKLGQVNGLGIEFELTGFDLREIQYLVDQAQEVGPGGIHTAQRFQRLFRLETRRVADHHLGQANDGVERRAQLVAHAGEKLRLVLACHLDLPIQMSQLFAHLVYICRQCAQLVTIGDVDALSEVTGRKPVKPCFDLLDRPNHRPRNGIA